MIIGQPGFLARPQLSKDDGFITEILCKNQYFIKSKIENRKSEIKAGSL